MNGRFSEESLLNYSKMVAEKQGLDFAEGEFYDFTTCIRPDGSAYGTSGKCRKGTEGEVKKEQSKAPAKSPSKAPAAKSPSSSPALNLPGDHPMVREYWETIEQFGSEEIANNAVFRAALKMKDPEAMQIQKDWAALRKKDQEITDRKLDRMKEIQSRKLPIEESRKLLEENRNRAGEERAALRAPMSELSDRTIQRGADIAKTFKPLIPAAPKTANAPAKLSKEQARQADSALEAARGMYPRGSREAKEVEAAFKALKGSTPTVDKKHHDVIARAVEGLQQSYPRESSEYRTMDNLLKKLS